MRRIYLDHNATTPLRPEVLESMLPYFAEHYGNPSSLHAWGREAKAALETSRETIARALGSPDKDSIVFTGSGTEADNLAIKGVAYAYEGKGRHIITSSVEHHAVLNPCHHLEKRGFLVTYLPVSSEGLLDLEELKRAIRKDTILVSLMHANNETGAVFPVEEASRLCRERGVLFHTDAIQSFTKLPLDVSSNPIDLVSISAHKLYGPKGVGALYIRRGIKLLPLLHGGHHERNRRAGTENLASIVGFARAVELSMAERQREGSRLMALRDSLEKGLMERIPRVRRNGPSKERLPHVTNLSFEFVEGEGLILSLDLVGVAVSSGSACTSGSLEPSHVLSSMGVPPEIAHGSLRFSLGRSTTSEDIEYVLQVLPPIVERMRAMSPLAA